MQPQQRLLRTFQPADTIATPARAMIDDPLWWLKVFAQEGPAAQTSMWPSNAASCLT
jgi:hypothetical protein